MALIKCAECQKGVSDKAAACPHCGHPIAGPPPLPPPLSEMLLRKDRKASAQRNTQIGCGLVGGLFVVGIFAFFNWAANEGSKIREAEHANPTCVSDYTKCTDNEELVNRHQDHNEISITVICKTKADAAAKYGKPELPFLAFRTFVKGRSFIDSGTAVLLEPDAAYHNAFNALEHVTARCLYDLKNDVASIELIRP